ncbi:MAG TPA: M56 family metallopeptidase [Puia sp.]|jgi:beta-lactamase regulating signal transducer with metallopeptidase domain|nr:M56 family metallopeptidase [Puia sp.]
MTTISESIIRALCWTLLHSLWQGLILAVVAGAVMLLTKRASSATRYGILGILVIGFLAVSGYTFLLELRMPVAATATAGTPAASAVTQGAQAIGAHAIGAHAQPAGGLVQLPGGIQQLVQYFNAHASIVVVVWFIVVLARFVKLLSGLVYAQRVRHYKTGPVPIEWQERLAMLVQRLRITRPVQLLESALVKVPVTVGWLKPVILVPLGMLAQLSADQVETILLHELAHIRRRDYLFNLVQNLIDTLYFFNPALLWVSSLIRTERENCCDDVAIRETRSRRQLIEALVSFHEYQQSVGRFMTARGHALAFADGHNGMVKRVERIVRKRNHSLNAGERLVLMGGVLLLCGAFITINSGRAAANPITASQTAEAKTIKSLPQVTPGILPATIHVATRVTTHVAVSTTTARADTTKPASASTPASAPAPASPSSDSTNVEKIIEAHDHGVTPEFLAELKRLGYTANLDMAIKLMDHGVSIDFLQSLKKEGYGLIRLEKAIKLMDHGVSVEFIQRIRAAGFPNLTLDEAVTLVDHGVSSDFIEQWKKKTGTLMALEDYIKLQDAGIDPS